MKNEVRLGSIYVLTCMITGEQYVGKALKTTAEKRWDQHIASALVKKSTCLIHKAIRKYGVENFTAEVVQCCTADKLNAAEKCWVKKLGTLVPGGYNLTIGGEGSYGFKHKPKTKRKMAATALKVWQRDGHRQMMSKLHVGYTVPLERRERISASLMGHAVSEDLREQLSISNKISLANDPARLARIKAGLHHTKAAKEKMSQAQCRIWVARKAAVNEA